MHRSSSFNVFNASAGSGKTFALVKEYLKLLFRSKQPHLFKNILALTFTNKAVGEMKSRIIEMLKAFSDEQILTDPNSMFTVISEELAANPKDLHIRSRQLLDRILHNYAAFDISTIDRFTHKIIRTFAFDLKIPINFEVELDTESLLSEAVDNLIAKAGTDQALTKMLIAFAIEKADDDKSWDISYDFNKIAKLLINENDTQYLSFLKNKTLDDFKDLKKVLQTKMAVSERSVIKKATETLDLIEECGLQFNDFTRSSLPKHFENLSKSRFDIKFDNNWQLDIENTTLYPARLSPDLASVIDSIKPQLLSSFRKTKLDVYKYRFYKNFYKNITPLSVINAISKELDLIKKERNLLLISEFNKVINDEIKGQPTPFIYERLGEKFKHYFIDEFQDTSNMQWDNLIPLIDNRLSTENGSAMIVGDAKQSIYRWRGGKPELFIDLYNKDSMPFMVEQNVVSLDHNYRSCKRVIEFNNSFFKHLSSFVFTDDAHKALYQASSQKDHIEEEGLVNIEFIEIGEDDDRDDIYPSSVKRTIETCLENGFDLKDICVLIRKKREGVAIADYLSAHDIDIISSETLLINRSPKVTFITDVLTYAMQPENKVVKASMLDHIQKTKGVEDVHGFLINGLALSSNELCKAFDRLGIQFDFDTLLERSLYDAVEYVIRAFHLVRTSDAYIQFYLDVVLDYSQKHSSSIVEFLAYWETKRNSLSITIPEGKNAVQIMTIHKAKGLEFPVVIFPYADLNIYKEQDPKIWMPLNKEEYNDFSFALLNYNKDIEHFGHHGADLYRRHQSQLELDNINLLYVTLTRAVEQLHIISKKDLDSKGHQKLNMYSGLFVNFLKSTGTWSESEKVYSFGDPRRQLQNMVKHSVSRTSTSFISHNNAVNIVTNSGYLWDTEQGQAIDKGNLVHDIMSKIVTQLDIEYVLNSFEDDGLINESQRKALNTTIEGIVDHPLLKTYYSTGVQVFNERDIIASNGMIIRPDRLVVDQNNEVIIIDYKTGAFDKKHMQQLITYADIIDTMELRVTKKILVYINEEINVKEV